MIRTLAIASVAVACSSPPPPAAHPVPPAPDAAPPVGDASIALVGESPVRWLRGSTHVHARPSGDSTTPIEDVIAWYEQHGYDFIVLTDHNRVTDVDGGTAGKVASRFGASGLVVLAGIELTYNPGTCLPPPPEPGGKCRIHVNALGVIARPDGKIEWAERKSDRRIDMYAKALATTADLGGVAQLNHPQWHWGMTAELLTELARRGMRLIEIRNVQFDTWNAGSATQPSTEALWDAALVAGVELWGVASDDAHDYRADGGGQYPAGGGWIMVRAPRDPDAIKAALAAGRFYASTGVTLARAEVQGGELVVEVDPASPGAHTITFIANGRVARAVSDRAARVEIPRDGYVRATIRRHADSAMAWVQPARR